jgi:carbon monoxide dehydrogenase subunit G
VIGLSAALRHEEQSRQRARHACKQEKAAARCRAAYRPRNAQSYRNGTSGVYGSPMRVEESVEIARAPEEVWAFVADPLNDPRWCRKVKSVEAAGPRRWRVVHKPVPLRAPMELVLEDVESEPPNRLTMREEDEASVFRVEYRLAPSTNGTYFTQASEFEWKKLPRILHATFRRGVRRDVRGQLQTLKRLLESE